MPAFEIPRRVTFVLIALAVATLTIGVAARRGAAREPRPPAVQQDTIRVATPVLLKKIAEAVDGTRTGGLVWVVANTNAPHTVAGTVERETDARTLARRAGASFAVFGPYRTYRDAFDVTPSNCVHNQWTSEMTPGICPPEIRLGQVDTMTLTLRMRDGTVRTIPLPAGTDAIFLTLSAVDKFAMPYYVRIVGVDSAAALRGSMTGSARPPR